jgi:putative transposase
MPRLARIVVPGVPHHVTQRGNRRQPTFFSEADFSAYKQLIATWCRKWDVQLWAYCLMPNHVHLVLAPSQPRSLARAVGEAHRRYTWTVNRREEWRGFLWQGRFSSFPMDEIHLFRAVRYILNNPVRAGLACRAEEWPHSSARAHVTQRPDGVVELEPLACRIEDWTALLSGSVPQRADEVLALHARTGRPLGSPDFVAQVERFAGRRLRPGAPGPKPTSRGASGSSSMGPDSGALRGPAHPVS